jgi:hypothetical protein
MTVYAETFVELAESQMGDTYVYGAKEPASDPNPKGHGGPFDCSGLVAWAVRRAGGIIPDGSTAQWHYCRDHGTLIPIDQAIKTRGALLGIETASDQHIVISRGDGTTIEARGRAWGVGEWNAPGRGWTWAGLVPGVSYTGTLLPPQLPGDRFLMALTDAEQTEIRDEIRQIHDAVADIESRLANVLQREVEALKAEFEQRFPPPVQPQG